MWYIVTQGNWNVLHPVKIIGMWYMITQGNWSVLHGKDNWNVVHGNAR